VLLVACQVPGPGAGAVYLQNGAARVVDQGNLAGQSPCSEGRGGLDRWCVFFKQKETTMRGQDVWAVNISRIGRGEDVRCNQPGPACVHVAAGDHVVYRGFVADTLLLDGAPAGASGMGTTRTTLPVSAWRPDWEGAVAVTSAPATSCWADATAEAVACVEQSHADAAAGEVGQLLAGRLTQSRRSLTTVPQGRDTVVASPASDSLLILLAPGIARLHLATGSLDVLPNGIDGPFGITPDESWIFWLSGTTRTGSTATSSLLDMAFPSGNSRTTLLADVLRYHFVTGPRARGADILAEAADGSGKSHLVLLGPDSSGAPLTTDLGSWNGTTADRLDATSADGYAVVADTEGTSVVSLLSPGPPCSLGKNAISSSEVALAPQLAVAFWITTGSGSVGVGHRTTITGCAAPEVFASDVQSLQLEGGKHLLFLDSAKHLFQLDATSATAQPRSMRDPDEVVYRWAYDDREDVLLLEMTSVFDTAVRLYALRHPF
jgi:hypothetical protein